MDQGSPSTDLLLDFLYVDRDRLQSYAAQLFNSGVLATTKTIDQTGSQSGGQLGIPGTNVLTGGSTLSSQERVFDASHTLPLNVLDKLDELGFVHGAMSEAGLGDLFLAEGRARFLDFKIIKNCWENIHTATVLEKQAQGQHMKSAERAQLKNNFKLMESLPHSTELTLHTEDEHIWMCLNPIHLKVDPATLAFSHGTAIPGKWTLLATLDARPDTEEDIINDSAQMPIVREMQAGMVQAMDGVRLMLGRPFAFYAATPILIFRTVHSKK